MCDCISSASPLPSFLFSNNRKLTARAERANVNLWTCSRRSNALHLIARLVGDAAERSANLDPQNREFHGQLGFKEDVGEGLNLETSGGLADYDPPLMKEAGGIVASGEAEDGGAGGSEGVRPPRGEEEEVVRVEGGRSSVNGRKLRVRSGRHVMRRSNIVAKQVISIESALSLGFVSQLWVDTSSWTVVAVEVRPNLLSGDAERFLLEDIYQVGDVVLVDNESVVETELKMVGLETLVGYEVVTPGRKSIGKVRGYTFNVNSGTVESLETDSFGISIIPSSLVSTYALFVEDVLEVASDKVFVHEAAATRLQRLTKGWLGSKKVGKSSDKLEEYYDFEELSRPPLKDPGAQKEFRRRKSRPRVRETQDDLDLPMDFL